MDPEVMFHEQLVGLVHGAGRGVLHREHSIVGAPTFDCFEDVGKGLARFRLCIRAEELSDCHLRVRAGDPLKRHSRHLSFSSVQSGRRVRASPR